MTANDYTEAAVQRLLSEDQSVADQGIEITHREQCLVLRGVVESPERRAEIERLVSQRYPDLQVCNEIAVTRHNAPAEAEELT
jgi:hypothetical protein